MLAVIGGTGLTTLTGFSQHGQLAVDTPYSDAPVVITQYLLGDLPLAFLARHGAQHTVPPHQVNYRANAWALQHVGVEGVVAINAVGGIRQDMAPGAFMVPDQLIDYTYGRAHTFFADDLQQVTHIDFTEPFSPSMRGLLLAAAATVNAKLSTPRVLGGSGVYGVMQGPRLETAAEVRKLQRDGCDIVGMTAMPEAALLRELEIPYASLSLSVNWAAGLTESEITLDEIRAVVEEGMDFVSAVIEQAVLLFNQSK